MPCARLMTALVFDLIKMGQLHDYCFSSPEISRKIRDFLSEERFLGKTFEISEKIGNIFGQKPFFGKHLGVEHSCP